MSDEKASVDAARDIVGRFLVYGDETANDELYEAILSALSAAERRGAERERADSELVAAVRGLFKLLCHLPEGAYRNGRTRWCFWSLSRDGALFDDVMDRLAAAMPPESQKES